MNSVIALAAARVWWHPESHGGQLHELGRGWAKSFMQRIGFVMRKTTKTAKKLPPNSEESYDISSAAAAENSIPDNLIVNWDQTGVRMVPVNYWTMTTRGSKQIFVTGLGDKRDTFFSNKCPF